MARVNSNVSRLRPRTISKNDTEGADKTEKKKGAATRTELLSGVLFILHVARTDRHFVELRDPSRAHVHAIQNDAKNERTFSGNETKPLDIFAMGTPTKGSEGNANLLRSALLFFLSFLSHRLQHWFGVLLLTCGTWTPASFKSK